MQQAPLPEVRPWQPPQPTDHLDVRVLSILLDGRVHDRHALARQVGASVRLLRASVSNLRTLGWPVCFGVHGGYRLSWETADLEFLLRKYRSQAMAELRVVNRLKRILRDKAA